ncbi:hypothetical protein [Achromobacter phage Motura]|uniref:Uncharacterized protein n=1 Tax=Achromobacter phage Motura TaxID=2591403 RepID=A0A514CSX8_9CAUD|nr:hypothetical protein H1O15_gp207 [Achromobacter phage Motura]QDH83581.1 hypothetical protein [Achromobacter phage Motura]
MSYFEETVRLLDKAWREPVPVRANICAALLPRVINAYQKVAARNMHEEAATLSSWIEDIGALLYVNAQLKLEGVAAKAE